MSPAKPFPLKWIAFSRNHSSWEQWCLQLRRARVLQPGPVLSLLPDGLPVLERDLAGVLGGRHAAPFNRRRMGLSHPPFVGVWNPHHPLLALFAVPVLFGIPYLYLWANAPR